MLLGKSRTLLKAATIDRRQTSWLPTAEQSTLKRRLQSQSRPSRSNTDTDRYHRQ